MVETTTTVTIEQPRTTTTTERGIGALKVDIGYFTTLPGILKLVQLVLGIICMSCNSPAVFGYMAFFMFVVVASFIITVLWSAAYLLGVRGALNLGFNWIFAELVNIFIVTLLYILSSILQCVNSANIYPSKYMAAGIVGLLNSVAYTASSYLLYVAFKSGQVL